MDIKQNYFQLFDLTPDFDLDMAELRRKHRHLQTEFHPDKYTQATAQEQRLAVQYAAYINQAWQVLSQPVSRGDYLLQISGFAHDDAHTLKNDNGFLFQQMQWREAAQELAAKPDESKLESMQDEVEADADKVLVQIKAAFVAEDFALAKQLLSRLQFILKFAHELSELEDSWDD